MTLIERGRELIAYFKYHAELAFKIAVEDNQLKKAASVWDWLDSKRDFLLLKRKSEGLDIVAVKPTDIIQQGVAGFKKAKDIKPILDLLIERNYLRKQVIVNKTGRKTTLYRIRPAEDI